MPVENEEEESEEEAYDAGKKSGDEILCSVLKQRKVKKECEEKNKPVMIYAGRTRTDLVIL